MLTIESGHTVIVRSLDASGHLARLTDPAVPPPTMFAAHRGHCLTGPPAWLLWELNVATGIATTRHGLTRTLAPFLGVIGVAPAEPGEHSAAPQSSAR